MFNPYIGRLDTSQSVGETPNLLSGPLLSSMDMPSTGWLIGILTMVYSIFVHNGVIKYPIPLDPNHHFFHVAFSFLRGGEKKSSPIRERRIHPAT